MNNLKKSLLVASSVMSIGAGSLGIAGVAHANSSSTSTGSSLVDKLVAKFGLNKSDVQAVFDANHTEKQAAMAQKITDKLAAGVKAGTITQAQSDAITAKIKELQASRAANHTKMESMTDAERKTAMEAERTALKQWISDNKIPAEFARLLGGGHGAMHRGMMDDDGHGDNMSPPSDSSTTN